MREQAMGGRGDEDLGSREQGIGCMARKKNDYDGHTLVGGDLFSVAVDAL